MCGIFGIVTYEDNLLGQILFEAGKRLSYRGYDSVGCATITQSGKIDLRKDVGRVEEVSERLNFVEMFGNRGIVQLRWATFGPPSKENAQPHIDSSGLMVGAHNGNVVNNAELRQEFINEGMVVRSTNDGETCVHAVERYLRRGSDFISSIQAAYQDLKGDYAFVIGHISDDKLYAFKKGSGLVVGVGENFTCVSSDLPSILPLTQEIIRVNDGEIVALSPSKVDIISVTNGKVIKRNIEVITENMDSVKKGGHPHFMLKEIYEQPRVAGELIRIMDNFPNMNEIIPELLRARNLYLVGCGTSYHACVLGSIYFAQLAGRAATPVLAPQFIPQYLPTLSSQDIGIFVSQSGETKDVLNAIRAAEPSGMRMFGVVNVLGSSLTKACDLYIPLGCGYEISVPATKTYMNQAIVFLYMALRAGQHKTKSLTHLPNYIQQTIELVETQIADLEPIFDQHNDLYCLGYGLTYPVALEAALKLKEITYAHCEGMLSTEFKHGPLSAVSDGYPIIFISSPDDVPLIVSGINEVTCRGGYVIAIGETDERLKLNANYTLELPKTNPYINALISIIPLQILSYRLCIRRGFDPDFPRNLSKTLTVD